MSICAALSEGGADRPKRMTHARRSRPSHVRCLCDEILKAEISKVHKNQLFCGWVCAAFARRRVLAADRRDGGHDSGSVTAALQVMVAGLSLGPCEPRSPGVGAARWPSAPASPPSPASRSTSPTPPGRERAEPDRETSMMLTTALSPPDPIRRARQNRAWNACCQGVLTPVVLVNGDR